MLPWHLLDPVIILLGKLSAEHFADTESCEENLLLDAVLPGRANPSEIVKKWEQLKCTPRGNGINNNQLIGWKQMKRFHVLLARMFLYTDI